MSCAAQWNLFTCQICAAAPPMDPPTFRRHLRIAHHCDLVGRQRALRRVDARAWYEWHYVWRMTPTARPFAYQVVRWARRRMDD